MKFFNLIILLLVLVFVVSSELESSTNIVQAQDIPELHMLILQGNIAILDQGNASELDGLLLEAKVNGSIIGTVTIGQTLSGRYSGLELGPNSSAEGGLIEFWIGNQKSVTTMIFGKLTVSGTYCKGCTWSLPESRVLNLNFNTVPQPTPTPAPDTAEPSFLTGTLIFGSILESPEGFDEIIAYSGDEIVGKGIVNNGTFSITIDPGDVTYVGKPIVFKIAGFSSKTTYSFLSDDFQIDYKLFFPEYIAPTPIPVIPTSVPPTPIPTPTPTPEATRTATPVPEPTPTYTTTPTPTAIVVSTMDDILSEDSSGGCNSRGGGPASVGLILLSLAPVYLLNRKRKIIK